jgi:hypothetical protein
MQQLLAGGNNMSKKVSKPLEKANRSTHPITGDETFPKLTPLCAVRGGGYKSTSLLL